MKVTILFDRRKTASKTKNGSVELLISHNGGQKIKSTGVCVKKHEWKNGMVVGRLDAQQLNERIRQRYNEEMMGAIDSPTIDVMTHRDKSFCDWLDKEIAERKDLTDGTRKHHRTMARHLRNSGFIVTFKDVTKVNVMRWDDALRKQLTNLESIRNYHKRLKPYVNKARHLGYIKDDPYEGVKIQRGKPTDIRYLTEDERTRIEELELDGTMAIVRDMFIFSCYTGLADADLRKVKREDIVREDGKEFIVDHRQKTGGKYRLMILPKAKEILERYDYNLDMFTNQKCNQYLKAIQAMANIRTHLTMHVGRHTFATWALKKGVPIEVVSKMLAHADIQTTQIYAKVLQEEVTKGFELLK
jgi:integrase